jgi:sarcosine oxidase, subunit alpha
VVPPEASQILADDGTIAGRITSSRMSPTLNRSICLAQVDKAISVPGTKLTVRLPDERHIEARVTESLAHVDPAGERQKIDTPAPAMRPQAPPVARSPIAPADPVTTAHGWEVSAQRGETAPRQALTLADYTPLAKIAVRAEPDGKLAAGLGTRFGRTARDADASLVVGSGPGEWLVLAGIGEQDKLLSRLRGTAEESAEFTSVIDLTHGRALVRLTGTQASDLLAKVCGVDLSDDFTPDGAAFRTSVAKLVTDVVRADEAGAPSYLLHCERSSGQYLFDALLDAGGEFGIEVDACPTSPTL